MVKIILYTFAMDSLEKKTKINDAIFKYALHEGVKDGVCDIAQSKFWYIREDQAAGFLALENSPEYHAAITSREIALLKMLKHTIAALFNGEPVNIIDLGCGDGTKAALCIESFMDIW